MTVFLNTLTLHKNGHKMTFVPLPLYQMAKSKFIEPLKKGDVLLSLLEPTLKVEPSEFKDLKEMILYTFSKHLN